MIDNDDDVILTTLWQGKQAGILTPMDYFTHWSPLL